MSDSLPLTLSPQAHTCPRCAISHDDRFYGPCQLCRDELRATLRNASRTVDLAEYEPKMNVTPNAVALKEND
ncbi:MAG: hypothetical protein ACKOJC_00940 [Actinomycetota bacterium]